MEQPLYQPFLVPSLERATEFPWSAGISRERGVYGFNSMDARSRSFNLIRAKLVALQRERDWRMMGIVSATPGVGKSFVSASLSAAMSRDPRYSTTLVDLDLRRGTIKNIFGIEAETGLAHFLEGLDPEAPIPAYKPKGEDLVIVPSVPANLHSAELLASDRAIQMLQALRASSARNYFFFDLPPVYANDDASTTLELLDGYVFVVEEGKTTQQEVESAIDMLGRERLAGVVLNKYRGGLISEGRGIEERYASDYYASDEDAETD
ncbi:MAG: CpsD/CapB family tyrosine-protein kinase [Sphingomicrobium sp.]